MEVQELLSQAKDAITVKRVFGEPYEKDGVTVVPVAAVRGGGGGGGGQSQQKTESGSGVGFGVSATPVGVYVIRDGQVTWQPAFDVNRAILGGSVAAVAMFLALRSAVKWRGKTRRVKLRRRD